MPNFRCPNDDRVFFTEDKNAPRIGVAHPDCDGPFCRSGIKSEPPEQARADEQKVIDAGANLPLVPLTAIMPVEITEHHVKFLQSRHYEGVKTVENARAFYDSLPRDLQPGFLADAAEWKGDQ